MPRQDVAAVPRRVFQGDPALAFCVYAEPIPQGSMKAIPSPGGFARLVSDNPRLHRWRATVAAMARAAQGPGWEPIDTAAAVAVEFYMPKPASRPKRRRTLPDRKPDVDKLARAVMDALTAGGAIADDARVVDLRTRERYAAPVAALALPHEEAAPCARIGVWRVDAEDTWADEPLVPFPEGAFDAYAITGAG